MTSLPACSPVEVFVRIVLGDGDPERRVDNRPMPGHSERVVAFSVGCSSGCLASLTFELDKVASLLQCFEVVPRSNVLINTVDEACAFWKSLQDITCKESQLNGHGSDRGGFRGQARDTSK
jgi:hypothetical protein